MFACSFAPEGWMVCNGQTLPTTYSPNLFKVIRFNFGGNGGSNFMLPNLQGAAPIGQGQGQGLSPRVIGSTGGKQTVTLTLNQIPVHNHQPAASLPATSSSPVGHTWSAPGNVRPAPDFYTDQTPGTLNLNPRAIGLIGQGLPHNNLMPFQILNFCIALQGDAPNPGL